METEPTREQRLAYRDWLLADQAAINARDEVLTAINADDGVIDLDLVERLSVKATELRRAADLALQAALAAVRIHDQEPAQAGEDTSTRFACIIRTIVDLEVHQISRRSYERHDEPLDTQR
jgi:hypothetical protein